MCHAGDGSGPIFLTAKTSSSLNTTCQDGTFRDNYDQSYVDPLTISCNSKMAPKILIMTNSSCATEGADGRTTDLERLTTVQIGWEIHNAFQTQIHLCVDELRYSTMWTRHAIEGASIDLRDTTSGRPGFKRDVTGNKRLFPEFPTQTAIAK